MVEGEIVRGVGECSSETELASRSRGRSAQDKAVKQQLKQMLGAAGGAASELASGSGRAADNATVQDLGVRSSKKAIAAGKVAADAAGKEPAASVAGKEPAGTAAAGTQAAPAAVPTGGGEKKKRTLEDLMGGAETPSDASTRKW